MYDSRDDSSGFDSRNGFRGVRSPIGTLLHTTSGTSSLDWLLHGAAAAGLPASADFLIDRNGTRHTIAPAGVIPYHAGVSVAYLHGRRFVNDQVSAMLIGIEMEQAGEQQVTYEQFDSCAELIVQLSDVFLWQWPYTILGHYEVARPLGRRSDPVNFSWGDFMGRLYYHAKVAGISGL